MTAARGLPAHPDIVVVTAVKALDAAKSRLASPAEGLREAVPGLVLAMLGDVLHTALAVPGIAAAYVISPDPAVHRAAATAGARTVVEPSPGGLNAALAAGAHAALADLGDVAVLALQPDLPGISVAELQAFLTAARWRRAFAPDHTGSGTAALFSPDGGDLRPEFGIDSAAAHEAGGAVRLAGPWPGLRTDVDTPSDLRSTPALGTRTTAALAAADRPIASKSEAGWDTMGS